MKSKWLVEKAEALQQAADTNDTKTIYKGLKEFYSPQNRGTAQFIADDGEMVLKMRDETLHWFAQHLDQLLNVPGLVNEAALNELPNVQGITELNMSWVSRT